MPISNSVVGSGTRVIVASGSVVLILRRHFQRDAKSKRFRAPGICSKKFETKKMKNEAMLKSQLMDKEFSLNMQLRGMEADQLQKREDNREKAKSDRISQQNSEQSKLINQRKNNLPPMTFESNEDSLDGFDLAEFEPR